MLIKLCSRLHTLNNKILCWLGSKCSCPLSQSDTHGRPIANLEKRNEWLLLTGMEFCWKDNSKNVGLAKKSNQKRPLGSRDLTPGLQSIHQMIVVQTPNFIEFWVSPDMANSNLLYTDCGESSRKFMCLWVLWKMHLIQQRGSHNICCCVWVKVK